MDIKELARFYFQDKLSKFCPADKTERPNGYEVAMFEAGYKKAQEEIEYLKSENETLKSKADWTLFDKRVETLQAENARLREVLEHIATLGNIFEEPASAKVASEALEKDLQK